MCRCSKTFTLADLGLGGKRCQACNNPLKHIHRQLRICRTYGIGILKMSEKKRAYKIDRYGYCQMVFYKMPFCLFETLCLFYPPGLAVCAHCAGFKVPQYVNLEKYALFALKTGSRINPYEVRCFEAGQQCFRWTRRQALCVIWTLSKKDFPNDLIRLIVLRYWQSFEVLFWQIAPFRTSSIWKRK